MPGHGAVRSQSIVIGPCVGIEEQSIHPLAQSTRTVSVMLGVIVVADGLGHLGHRRVRLVRQRVEDGVGFGEYVAVALARRPVDDIAVCSTIASVRAFGLRDEAGLLI